MRIIVVLMFLHTPMFAFGASDLGDHTGVLSFGKYSNASHLLTKVEISEWGDSYILSGKLDYMPGYVTPKKINVRLTRGKGGTWDDYRFQTYVTTYSYYSGYFCTFYVTIAIRAFENGFLIQRYGATINDVDYCIEHGKGWAPEIKPYFLKDPT